MLLLYVCISYGILLAIKPFTCSAIGTTALRKGVPLQKAERMLHFITGKKKVHGEIEQKIPAAEAVEMDKYVDNYDIIVYNSV